MKIIQPFCFSLMIVLMLWSCSSPEKQQPIDGTQIADSYVLVEDWPKLPEGFNLGNPTGLGMDSDQNILVFHRGSRVWEEPMPTDKIKENTILVLNKDGQLLRSWGSDLFIMPHGLEVDTEDNVWVTDVGLHQVFKFSSDGQLQMVLGEAGIPGDDSLHFNLPTDVAVAADGSFYVSDGYGNSRVVKFAGDGTYLFEWGKLGSEPGEFITPHGIDLDNDGNVYVADRENNRIQKFDANGAFINLWQNDTAQQLYSVAVDAQNGHLFGIDYLIEEDTIVIGSDILRFDLGINQQLRFGKSGSYDGPIARYHDIQVDDEGNLYTGDILGNRVQKFELSGSVE